MEQLNHEAEIATERYNEAVERLQAAEKRLNVVQDRIAAQQRRLNVLQDELGAFAALAYRNAGIDRTLQLLTSNDPTQFLNQASTLDQLSDQQAGVLRRLQAAQQELQVTRMKADQEIDEIESARKELSTQKRTVEEKLRKARALLNQLTAEQRQEIVSPPTDPPPPPPANATGRAATAVAYARAQLGDPYVWGSAGPDSFDCSGLTMAAWAAAGVSLPHSSAGQYGYGQFVPQSSLAPGDLVFYYSPISHVGIYVGSGMIIHSPHAGDVVRVAGVNSMPYVGARRVG
ncbi:MAG: NlpC/P60 family protein [Actinomycetes bacterium]|nr:NlpC/P60 family protein [Actinomycetes bacterium]